MSAISSRAIIEELIDKDLTNLAQEISIQLSSIDTPETSYAELIRLLELTHSNLTAYAYSVDLSSPESTLNSIEFIRDHIRPSEANQEAITTILGLLDEYQALSNQVVYQTQNYLYLTNVVLAGLAGEYIYFSEELHSAMNDQFLQESQITRSQINAAEQSTLFLSIALLFSVVGSFLALGYFLYRLASLERSLRESSRRHKLIIDQANTGIAEVGLDGSWISVNQKICEMFDYSEDKLTSLTWQDITHPDDLGIDMSLVEKIVNGEIDHYTLDKRYLRRGGVIFWARLKVAAHKNEQGELLNFISTIENIDDLKQQEKLLLKTNTGLEKEVEERLKELERSNAELEQFAYIASHDLQEPLRMVSSYMQLVEDRYKHLLDDDGKEFINYAVDGALRMQALIKSLLEYSRVGADQTVHKIVDMQSVLDEAEQYLEKLINTSNALITSDELPTIFGNKLQLIQLLLNLIANAIKYTASDEQPKIHISAARSGQNDEWLFSVQDNGIGFDQEHADKIFVIFRRLHTKEEYAGTGIGLAVCKKIIERHGGQIWAKSQPGKGSTFFFTLRSTDEGGY